MVKRVLAVVLTLAFSGSAHAAVVKLECTSTSDYSKLEYHLDSEKKTIKCHQTRTSTCRDEWVGPHDLTSDDENHYWQHDLDHFGEIKLITYELNRTTLRMLWGYEGLTLQRNCLILGPPKI